MGAIYFIDNNNKYELTAISSCLRMDRNEFTNSLLATKMCSCKRRQGDYTYRVRGMCVNFLIFYLDFDGCQIESKYELHFLILDNILKFV